MISVNNISLNFSKQVLFDGISFLIRPNDRIGLVGNNGSGKTTLLKIILGTQEPDNGSIEKPSGLTIGYLPQQMKHVDNKSLFNEVKTAFGPLLKLQDKADYIGSLIENSSDFHSQEYLSLINELSDINTRLDMLGAAKMDEQIEKTLYGLGFVLEDMPRQTSHFSGGWRMRIELAKILLANPDILLLDEPTNHLDIESIQWLEQFLATYRGAVVLISHDRAFLDNVTKRTIEISLGKIYDYKVPYSKFTALRKERRQQQLAAYKNQQKEIADINRFIERFRYKNTKAVQVQSRIKYLDKLE
ncbi:MAG: ABC-F family ATP-binding cassette domain-containing protein, partial [Actinobacteria bacterium]|nr:ABC-F family ATP-binding cassette domain-containing protein [Actinomycetota bacterium]